MNAVECIKTRRSVRKFTDEMVSVDTVRGIVELASYAHHGRIHRLSDIHLWRIRRS
ncbi:nitroreductase family protein [Coprococcus sp. OM06-25]|uniref:nitroreductase family protein n=1 Tax=Coprococcus sp. OM06-25 TaxID=2293094 RepID=UPI002E8E4B4E